MGRSVAPAIWMAGAAVGVVVAAGLAGIWSLMIPEPAVVTGRAHSVAAPGIRADTPVGSATDPAPAAAPPASDPAATEGGQADAGLAGPEVDTFSYARDGSAVLAGRAPGSLRVELRHEGTVLAEAAPDRAGRFAMLFDLAPAPVARSLSLIGYDDQGRSTEGSRQLLVAPTPEAVAQTAPEPTAEQAPVQLAAANAAPERPQGAAPVSSSDSPSDSPATSPPAEPVVAAQLAAPSSLLVSPGGIEVLRREPVNGLSIDAIAYGEDGTVQVTGQARAGERVQLYLDNRGGPALNADPQGRWQAVLTDVKPGLYTLRADQAGVDGRVSARAETPFLRESPEALAAGGGQPAQSGVVTVQPGFTLWGIARDQLGDGLQYVKVFEANRSQIRNPDLIYPGQVFTLPPG